MKDPSTEISKQYKTEFRKLGSKNSLLSTKIGILKDWCYRVLAHTHLTATASFLVKELNIRSEKLTELGIPGDLLNLFPAWKQGKNNGFRIKKTGNLVTPIGAGQELKAFRIQLSQDYRAVPISINLLKEMLSTFERTVKIIVVVKPGSNLRGLNALVKRFDPGNAGRVHFLQLASSSLFAQDNARAAIDPHGESILLIPREFDRGEDAIVQSLAEKEFKQPIKQSLLFWEGGNIINDQKNCFVGVNTIADNICKLGLSSQEIVSILEAEFGLPITLLGDLRRIEIDAESGIRVTSGQPSFHIDLDVSPLGSIDKGLSKTLLSDPMLGLQFLPAVFRQKNVLSNSFLSPKDLREYLMNEYKTFAEEKSILLDEFEKTFIGLGYSVIKLPSLNIPNSKNFFGLVNLNYGYCNVLPGTYQKMPAVYALPWGIGTMDRWVELRLKKEGIKLVWITKNPTWANELMLFDGGLHCFAGSVGL